MSDLVLADGYAGAIMDIMDAEEKGYLEVRFVARELTDPFDVRLTMAGADAIRDGDVPMMALATGMRLIAPNGEDVRHLLPRSVDTDLLVDRFLNEPLASRL